MNEDASIEQVTVVFVCQALDVWAMGVTLYCFVYGMVSDDRRGSVIN